MKITMSSSPPNNLIQIEKFLNLPRKTKFKFDSKRDCYKFFRKTTWNLHYKKLSREDRGKVLRYLKFISGYSVSHTKRLVLKAITGKLFDPKTTRNKTSFQRKYSDEDVKLFAEFDGLANYPNGFALQENFRRMYENFKNESFKHLAGISHGQIYNLRKTTLYRKITSKYKHTEAVSQNKIGVREKPDPKGRPGFIRVDSVHGGDKDNEKGVYYINLVDEITQSEIVICVKGISERFLSEVWDEILVSFPFVVINFHSDNGSEFVNKVVADILNRLHIRQTKSRPRKHNDNGLVESKNGWVIRKHFGYIFVHRECAPLINEFLDKYFNRFLNYHRPCAFPTRKILPNGKVKITYKKEDYKTPYEKLKEIDPKGKYLQKGLTYDKLDKDAYNISDFDFLKVMKEEYRKMLRKIRQKTDKLLLAQNPSSVSS